MTLEDGIRYVGGMFEVAGVVMAWLWIRERRLLVGDAPWVTKVWAASRRAFNRLLVRLGRRQPDGRLDIASASLNVSGGGAARASGSAILTGSLEEQIERLQRDLQHLATRVKRLDDKVEEKHRELRREISAERTERAREIARLDEEQRQSVRRDFTWDRRAVLFIAIGAVLTTFNSELAGVLRAVT